jgi:hypothetical protein
MTLERSAALAPRIRSQHEAQRIVATGRCELDEPVFGIKRRHG